MSQTVTDPQPRLFFGWLSVGLISLLISIISLILRPEILTGAVMSPVTVAWVHLFILGWICSLYFAAGYQLIPVVTLNPLFSRRLSRVHLIFHTAGLLMMIPSFYRTDTLGLAVGGGLVCVGFLLFAINSILNSGMRPVWNHASVIWSMGIFWLLVGGGLALLAVFHRLHPLDNLNYLTVVGLHIHTVVLGFFLLLLIASASKMVPMFMLSTERPQWGTWISGMLISTVLLIAIPLAGKEIPLLRTTLSWIMLAAVLAFLGQMLRFIATRKRAFDAGMGLFFASVLLLLPAWSFFHRYHSAGDAAEISHLSAGVFTLLFLVFNGCILGMAQKIVPFMLWHHFYAKHLGRFRVPQTMDLLNAWTLWPIGICFSLSAVLFLSFSLDGNALLIRPAAGCMLLAFIFMLCNAPKCAEHWRQPKLEAFSKKHS